jgi:6-phosphofructo-2-kinase/fructose-2,6-biphosphatase 2
VCVCEFELIQHSLKTLDESTKVIRQSAKGLERAPSVSGIGNVGALLILALAPCFRSLTIAAVEKPDYSEAKIVVAMVRPWRQSVKTRN